MNTELPTSEVLNRAADDLEEHGWVTGNGGMCRCGRAGVERIRAERAENNVRTLQHCLDHLRSTTGGRR